jgi:HTH-type transcriptional regulator/antitoxin HipB
MLIRNPTDLGAFIRERRMKLGLDQAELAEKAGTSRKWLIEVERGKPRAAIGLILRRLRSLEISVDLQADSLEEASSARSGSVTHLQTPDIQSILDSLKKSK